MGQDLRIQDEVFKWHRDTRHPPSEEQAQADQIFPAHAHAFQSASKQGVGRSVGCRSNAAASGVQMQSCKQNLNARPAAKI